MSVNHMIIVTEVRRNSINPNEEALVSSGPEREDVRRPLDSLSAREDSYATLSLRAASVNKLLKNTSNPKGDSAYTANMLVQSLQFSVQEKSQLAQTFDRDRVFFFGQALPTVAVSAKVMENETFQWLQEFWTNYSTRIGGSVAAQSGAKVRFRTEDKTFDGYIMNMGFSRTSSDRHTSDVSFSMSITDTQFTRDLKTKAAVSRVTGVGGGEPLDTLGALIRDQRVALSSRTASLPGVPLSSHVTQPPADIRADLASMGFERKEVPLRDAYNMEFPYTRSGKSYDELGEVAAVLYMEEELWWGLSSAVAPLDTQAIRDAIDGRVALSRQEALNASHAVAGEDIFTPYVEPIPMEISAALVALKRVGAAASVLALTSAATSLATEAINAHETGASFSFERAGKRMMDKAFGTEMETPPFDDSRVFT